MAGQDWFEKDFYSVLGVPKDASQDDIKKVYRKLARQYHPDTNSGDAGGGQAAERRFKEIGEAYGVLSDPEQRQQYDAVRAMARGGARFTAGGPGGGAGFEDIFGGLFGGAPGGVRFTTTGGVPGGGAPGGGPSLEDLLGGMGWGGAGGPGAGGMGFRAPRPPRRGEDLVAETTLTFRQAVEGALLTLQLDDPRLGRRTVNARVPAGVRDGQKVRLRGKGGQSGPGGEPGDLVVSVHVEKHPVFELDGADVRVTVPVTFPEAVLGAQIEVPTVDGATIRMRVPQGTPSGRVLRAKGRGIRTKSRTGDLLVTLQVAVPQRVDGAARAALEAFRDATADHDPRAELLAQVRDAGGRDQGTREAGVG
ncbi:MAG: DnaJ domain-containing protein [Actinomycetales bacterium]|nr:DnaJ domain-containing protein [Actinomycetales bacterium]